MSIQRREGLVVGGRRGDGGGTGTGTGLSEGAVQRKETGHDGGWETRACIMGKARVPGRHGVSRTVRVSF